MSDKTSSPVAGQPSRTGGEVAPARAAGVVLIGEMQGSGYRVPPALARRADGQTVQLTPLLYATLAALDGRRSYDDVAAEVSVAAGRDVTEENARVLVEKLAPLGLVAQADGTQPCSPRSNPLLGLRLKVAVSDPERTNRITAPFAALFHWALVTPVVAAFCWITWWVLIDEGLAAATHEAFARPGLLLAVLAVTVLSAGFHELGHAAAARRGGATPGVMGAGLYLIWPAFYTDVTDSYRLGRAGRIRTDLGGLYFNAIVAVATVGVWWASEYDALLLLVATQVLQMLRQLLPLVRFDGYHVLADVTGVPDLFQRIGPTLAALVPWRSTPPEAKALKPWARLVVTAWVLTVVPVLLLVALLLVLTLPRIVGTAWAAMGQQRELMGAAFHDGDVVAGIARALAAVIVVLPVLAIGYLLVRLARQVGGAVWRRTEGRPLRRAGAGIVALALVAGLAAVWWPSEHRYRPIQAWEGGTLTQAVALASPPSGGLAVGSQGAGTVMWPDDQPLPTREKPQLALVAVPSQNGGAATFEDGAGDLDEGDTDLDGGDAWIFPFDEPLPPGEGDNQALAVNTTDDSVTYDVAFALVWADGDDVADNTNDAYAIASCDSCAAVAVAFQVVLVTGATDVAIPTNVSVAINYNCTSCLTFSLAVQLFVTLDGPLSAEAVAAIEDVWAEALAFARGIGQVPLDEIQDTLEEFEEQIIGIIEDEQGPLTEDPSDQTSPSDSSTPSVTDGATSPTTVVSSSSLSEVSSPSPSPSESPSTVGSSPSATSTGSEPSGSPSAPVSSTVPTATPSSTTTP